MKDNKKIAENFKKIFEKEFDPTMFPIKDKEDNIKIGKYIVSKFKYGYRVKNLSNPQEVTETHSRTAAIALAKKEGKRKNIKEQILYLDRMIYKNYMDCLYYNNSLKSKKQSEEKDCLNIRFECSFQKIEEAKEQLKFYALN